MTAKTPLPAWPADQVERRSVESLIPYARNARTHSEAQVAQLAASIREWGWTVPVLIDESGTLIAGHGRVMAARLLELTEVPVMVARGWSEAKTRAYVLADNKLAMNAGWDEDMLRAELEALTDAGFNMALTGFSLDDLTELALDVEEVGELDQLASPNSVDSKTLQMTFGKKKCPLTDAELATLTAKFEAHINEFGMASGFIEQLFRV